MGKICKVNNCKEYRTTESEGSQAGQRRTSLPFGALHFTICLPCLVSVCVRLSRRRASADDLYKRQAHAPSSQPQLCYIPDCVNKWTVEVSPKEEKLKTERQLRFELSVIKWYYTQLAKGKTNVKVSDSRLPNFPQLLADYNAAIQTAPRPVQRLWQDMYLSGTNATQKQLANQWCVTEKYVQILNKRLVKCIYENEV